MLYLNFVSKLEKPWISITSEPILQQNIPENILLLTLNGNRMTTLDDTYREIMSAFQFPDYFGKNFNSLSECLTDLEWLPAKGYLVIVKNAEFILRCEPDEALVGLLSILNDTGMEWSTPVTQGSEWDRNGIPFHSVLEIDKSSISGFLKKLGGYEIPCL